MRTVENDEYAAFVRRILKAYGVRIDMGDVDAVADMVAIGRELDDLIQQAVGGLRGKGYSWSDIGRRAGVSKQAAHERWSHRGKPQARLSVREIDLSYRPDLPHGTASRTAVMLRHDGTWQVFLGAETHGTRRPPSGA